MSGPADAVALARAIRAGELSPVEAVETTFAAIAEIDPAVNAFTVLLPEEARREARRAEVTLRSGKPLGPLHGVPVAVKDVIWMRGAPATNGSLIWRDFVPDTDAVAVRRLREAGAIVVGKTNNPEFCHRGVTDNRVYGLTRNPWDLDRTPGGSSGGSGAAVAAGMVPFALGGDAGGSIRIPASFCGVAGLKPTFGRIPQGPGFPGFKSLSTKGALARSVCDLALCLDVLAGPDPSDDLGLPAERTEYLPVAEDADGSTLRVAYSLDLGFAAVEPGVRRVFAEAVATLREAGWRLEEAHPDVGDGTGLWYEIALCECYAAEGQFLEQRELLEPATVQLLEAGAGRSARDYIEAQVERTRYAQAWLAFFTEYDLLLTPTVQLTAFPVGVDGPTEIDGRAIDSFYDDWCAFCYPANLTRQPAVSIPCGFDEAGLPVGLQLTGRLFRDDQVLAAAAAAERVLPGPSLPPLARERLAPD